jgi:hypothetical protein
MNRLRDALGVCDMNTAPPELVAYTELTDRAPNAVWSESMWTWGVTRNADWFLTLQDDASVAPNFWPILRAILEALPGGAEVLGLQVTHPA